MAVGPGTAASALDTLESVRWGLPDHTAVLVDDHTTDGTYEEIAGATADDGRVHLLRTPEPNGYPGLTHTLAQGFRFVLAELDAPLVLKLDTDALITAHGLAADATAFVAAHPEVGMFGRHLVNVDGTTKDFSMHTAYFERELAFRRRWAADRGDYRRLARRALRNGWQLGENVFGGAYFVTQACLADMGDLDALQPHPRWRVRAMPEDCYFTMLTYATGRRAGQFGVPEGPMCLAWKGLPVPASEIIARGWSVAHSVDKGPLTSPEENGGAMPRELFRAHRLASPRPQGDGVR